jgi:hypothetical protein
MVLNKKIGQKQYIFMNKRQRTSGGDVGWWISALKNDSILLHAVQMDEQKQYSDKKKI